MLRPRILFFVCLCLAPFHNSVAQSEGLHRFVRWTVDDGRSLGTAVVRSSPLWLGAGAFAVLPSKTIDAELLEEIQEGYRGWAVPYLNFANRLGGKEVPIPVVGIFSLSLLTHNARFQDAAFTSMESLFYAGILTGGLKAAIGRARPESNQGTFRLSPFSGNSSFPSGHTTAVFAILTPWVLYYPNGLTYSLFILSSSTAVARIALDKHWPTDVLAGAAIGVLTARFLTAKHQAAANRFSRLTISPMASTTGSGIMLNYRF